MSKFYKALKKGRYGDREYGAGELIPAEVVYSPAVPRLFKMGLIAEINSAVGAPSTASLNAPGAAEKEPGPNTHETDKNDAQGQPEGEAADKTLVPPEDENPGQEQDDETGDEDPDDEDPDDEDPDDEDPDDEDPDDEDPDEDPGENPERAPDKLSDRKLRKSNMKKLWEIASAAPFGFAFDASLSKAQLIEIIKIAQRGE